MIDYSSLYKALEDTPLATWLPALPGQIANGLSQARWGDMPDWLESLAALPEIPTAEVDLLNGVRIGTDSAATTQQQLKTALQGLHPWRKGPLWLHGVHIDTEWRSDWKWERLAAHITSLKDRLVLDVGCGNGYYSLRMAGAGAARVIGIDPSAKFVMQFLAIKKYLGDIAVDVLPLGIEAVPINLQAFDSVFSMGVLYHRRSPMDHLIELRQTLKPGGQLILETLVVDGDKNTLLVPPGRYAKMRNVWFLPSVEALLSWMEKCGFRDPRCVDVTPTSLEEQRRTDWMQFESLADFLDPDDQTKTVEGHPAPKRAVLIAEAP